MAEDKTLEVAAQDESDRELGTKPINSLFFKYLGINLIGLVITGIVVIIEGIIIGNGLGAHGLAITGLGMTLEILNIALGSAFAAGVATAAGNRLGAGDTEGARAAFARGFWLTEIITITIAALLFIFAPQVAVAIGATEELVPDTILFIRIFVCFFPFTVGGQMLSAMLRVDEKPTLATIVLTVSSVSALIYLYVTVMIVHMGIPASATYYGFSMGIASIAIFYFLFSKSTIFKIHISDIKDSFKIAKEVISVGTPSFLVQLASMAYTIVVNNALGIFGGADAAMQIAAYSLLNGYIVYVINLMWIASQYAVQPIAAFNHGAKAYCRLKQLLRISLIGTGGVVLTVSIIFIVFAEPICGIFVAEGEEALAELGATYVLPLCMLGFLGTLSNVMCTYFQSVQKVVISIVLGICRYAIFTIPLILIMSQFMGVDGIWWAQPVADVCAFLFTMVFVLREMKLMSKLEKEQASAIEAA